MELIAHQKAAHDFFKKWRAALDVIATRDGEKDALEKEITDLRREEYRLRESIFQKRALKK